MMLVALLRSQSRTFHRSLHGGGTRSMVKLRDFNLRVCAVQLQVFSVPFMVYSNF